MEIILIVAIFVFAFCIALLLKAFSNRNNTCPICKQKIGMNSITTRDKRVVCLKCCRKAGVKLHNTKSYNTVEEIKAMIGE